MRPFTTSAQKTIELPVEDILEKLENELSKSENVKFEQTKHDNILKAKMKDGSTLVIAGFEKNNGNSLAMIDHKNVPSNSTRSVIQQKWKNKLKQLFA